MSKFRSYARRLVLGGFACVLVYAALGCAHDLSARDTPFTKAWAYQRKRDAEKRPHRDELVLFGGEKGARAAIKIDEKGKPRLNVFEKRGLSADLDVDSDEVEVGIKYKKGWGGAKETGPRPVPEGHRTLP